MAGPMVHQLGGKPHRPFGYDQGKVDVEEWVRVPAGEEPNDEFSVSPSQRQRSRPRLQSPDANLDRSSSTAGTPRPVG